MDPLRRDFQNPPASHRAAPLWVWNDLMSENQIETQLKELKSHGFTDGRVHIAHCGNPAAAARLKKMIHAVFPAAQVDVGLCGGLCSYYAELGGLMVGYEDGEAPVIEK